MHHPIPVRDGADPPGFGVADAELAVGPGTVGEAAQLLLQPQQFGAQQGVEGDPRGHGDAGGAGDATPE
jgi:hypothetical protein